MEIPQSSRVGDSGHDKKSRHGRALKALDHVGLLFIGPPGMAGLPFI
jgi:hypothetical protein